MQENSLPKPSHAEQQGSTTTTTKQVANVGTDRKPALAAGLQPPEQSLNCPRCDSPNTKFCYYNNYSLTQPRHFCKTCRRYWTKGGALRNVPIGGGCRKNKRSKSSQRNTDEPKVLPESVGKYFPAMDFGLPFSRLQSSQPGFFNHLFSVGGLSSSCSPISSSSPHVIDSSPPVSLLGFNYLTKHGESNGGFPCLGSQSSHSSLASSIESLSTINADLHWKLQQQRLGMFFSGENQKETGISGGDSVTPQHSSLIHAGLLDYQEHQPISFQNLDTSKNGDSGNNSRKSSVHDTGLIRESTTEWLFDNSYATTTTTATNNTTTNTTTNNWNGLQAWTDFQQYSALN